MIKCQVCGKECKTVQGLAGHMQNKHGILGAHPDAERLAPSPKLVSELQLSELSERVGELEGSVALLEAEQNGEYRAGGSGEPAERSKELTERVSELTEQLNQLSEQVGQCSLAKLSDAEIAQLGEQVSAELVAVMAELGNTVKRGSLITELATELSHNTIGDLVRESAGEISVDAPMQKLERRLSECRLVK
ncbi:unnamed protein product [marine sediment metagenome]|uniref:C2H2-type domain-containing protein n=1 Tax=marine sediment metagenome TaxID=412755 RepID=X1RUD9_9ZZZZ